MDVSACETSVFFFRTGEWSRVKMGCLFFSKDLEHVRGRRSFEKSLAKVLIIHQARNSTQEFDMGSDHVFPPHKQKHDPDWLVVEGLIVDGLGRDSKGSDNITDGVRFGMRDREPGPHAG